MCGHPSSHAVFASLFPRANSPNSRLLALERSQGILEEELDLTDPGQAVLTSSPFRKQISEQGTALTPYSHCLVQSPAV